MRFQNVAIEAVTAELAPERVKSAALEDRLNGALGRWRLPPKPIELLTGIEERAFWPPGTAIADVAARVGRRALDAAGVAAAEVGLLVNTSVSKEFLEPSVASLVHGQLGLGADCRNFDVANACLGFLSGIELAGQLIEGGVVDYALLVDAESSRPVIETTLGRLAGPGATAEEFWSNFATLTLGSGAVAMVLGRADRSRTTHRVHGSVALADTSQYDLCVGSFEGMVTDSTRLLKAGVELARRTWARAAAELPRWSVAGIDQYLVHQVGRPHLAALSEALGIPPDRCFASYPRHGNVGPAAIPLTLLLAEQAGRVRPGDHLALMGIGSGLNVAMMSVSW